MLYAAIRHGPVGDAVLSGYDSKAGARTLGLRERSLLLAYEESPEQIGRISGSGAAMGYWGGVVALFLVLLSKIPAFNSSVPRSSSAIGPGPLSPSRRSPIPALL